MVATKLACGAGWRWALEIDTSGMSLKPTIERRQVGQILAAVQRRQGPFRDRAEQRELKRIEMKMEDVEVVDAPAHLVEHQHVMGNGVADAGIVAQARRARRRRAPRR